MPKTGIRPNETKTKGRRWLAYYYRDGKQVNRRGFRTARAAEQWRADAMINAASPADSRITVGEWVTEWLERHRSNIEPSTYERYENSFRVWVLPHLGMIRLARLSHKHIEEMHHEALMAGRSPLTVRNNNSPLRKALEQAVRDGLIPSNPAALVQMPKRRDREIEPFTLEEMHRFLNANRDQEVYSVYHLALWSGLRLGEIMALRVGRDIDLFSRTITVREKRRKGAIGPPKSRSGRRRIPISTEAAVVLGRSIQDKTDGDLAFPFSPDGASHSMEAACKRAGLKKIRFHDLRHTHATHLLAAGENINAVSARLGHADVGVTLSDLRSRLAGDVGGVGRGYGADFRHRLYQNPITGRIRVGYENPRNGCIDGFKPT